jgi:hypothetical protein
MANTLSSEESASARRLALGVYGAYCLIGFTGVVVGFSKGGSPRLVGAAFDLAAFLLAVFFLTKAMADPPPTRRAVSSRAGLLLCLVTFPHVLKFVFF